MTGFTLVEHSGKWKIDGGIRQVMSHEEVNVLMGVCLKTIVGSLV